MLILLGVLQAMISITLIPLTLTLATAFTAVAQSSLADVGVVFGVLMALWAASFRFPKNTDMRAIANRIGCVLNRSAIGKVGEVIIQMVAIKMANLHAFWARTNKCQRDEVMNHPVSVGHLDPKILASMAFGTKADGEFMFLPSARSNYSCAVLINEIPVAARNRNQCHGLIISVLGV